MQYGTAGRHGAGQTWHCRTSALRDLQLIDLPLDQRSPTDVVYRSSRIRFALRHIPQRGLQRFMPGELRHHLQWHTCIDQIFRKAVPQAVEGATLTRRIIKFKIHKK